MCMDNCIKRYENKIVLVTGASRGIGAAIAARFAKEGAVVIVNYSGNDEAADRTVENILAANGKAEKYKCQVDSYEETEKMITYIMGKYKRIDILINNAGIAIDTLFEDKTKDNFMKTLDINLIASFLLCKKIGPKMVDNKYGVIINISSTNGIDTPYIESIDYDASKAGLISLSKNLANYFAPYVRVNTICPGWVNTEMNKNLDSDFISKEENKILLGRFANPREVANLVEFLISDKANYINDSIIRIDGGIKC